MDYEMFKMQIKSLGFKLNSRNILIGDDVEFAIVTRSYLRTITEINVDLSEIQFISYMQVDKILRLFIGDDQFVELKGGRFPRDETGVELSVKNMPMCISELNSVFEYIYPDAKKKIYYDELQESDMVDMSIFSRQSEGLLVYDDKITSIYYDHLENKLKEMGYVGSRFPPTSVRDNVMNIQFHNNSRNLFREWVEGLKWDGKPRVRTWFQETFGATAPPLESTNMDDMYMGDVAEAWFIGAIKRMYSITKHEIVPVLIADQGIGKGLGIKYTAGRDTWFTESSVDVGEPGGAERFLDGVRGSIIVELSESSQIRTKNVEMLKSFISKPFDQMRKAYARRDQRYPRHFILIATSNLDNIFTDITGNRRFFPMYCDPSRATREFSEDRTVGQYDVEQVWAEALELYNKGHRWYLSMDSARIAKIMQDFSTQENSGISAVTDWLNDPSNGYTEIGARISREVILRNVYNVTLSTVTADVTKAVNAWMNGQTEWKKVMSPTRIHGKVARAFERVCSPGNEKAIERLKIVPGRTVEEDIMSITPEYIMRERAIKYGFRDTGDDFPTEGLDKNVIDMLYDSGYIYEASLNPLTYKITYLP